MLLFGDFCQITSVVQDSMNTKGNIVNQSLYPLGSYNNISAHKHESAPQWK